MTRARAAAGASGGVHSGGAHSGSHTCEEPASSKNSTYASPPFTFRWFIGCTLQEKAEMGDAQVSYGTMWADKGTKDPAVSNKSLSDAKDAVPIWIV